MSKAKGVQVQGTLRVGYGKSRKLSQVLVIAPYGNTGTVDLVFVADAKNIEINLDRESAIKLIARIKDELHVE